MMFRVTVVVLLMAVAATAGAAPEPLVRSATPGDAPPAIGIESLAWLAGHWRGEALGGTVDEIWAPPAGGRMVGLFRVVARGEVQFHEIMILAVIGDRLTLRLKHFDADLLGWEEKGETVDFPLLAQEGEVWFFDGLTIERRADDAATIHVRVGGAEGNEVMSFPYARVAPR